MMAARRADRGRLARCTLRSDASGAAVIEMALALPIFLLAMFFVVEAGRVMYSRVDLEYALLHAARYSMIATSASESSVEGAMSTRFMLLSAGNVKDFSLTETVNSDKTRNTTLSVSYDVRFVIPMLTKKTITLTQTVKFLWASA